MRLLIIMVCLALIASLVWGQELSGAQNEKLGIRASSSPMGGSGLINLQTAPTNPVGTFAISLHALVVDHEVWKMGRETVTTGVAAFTFSLTNDVEAYFMASFFGGARPIQPDWTLANGTKGLGNQEIGLKYRFPLKRHGLLQMAATAGFVLGTSERKVLGYNFWLTRRQSDIKLRLVESLLLQRAYGLPNLHFQQGYLTQYGIIPDMLLLGVGADYSFGRYQAIAELESRVEQDLPIYLNEDYLALTTALRYHTNHGVALDLGMNFGLSKDRALDNSWRRTDDWQAFMGITFTPQVKSSDFDRDGIPDWLDSELNIPGYNQNQMAQAVASPSYNDAAFAFSAADLDGDGVPDFRDKEPTSMRGAVVDSNGVALDDDKDGVPNGLDREPRTPEGARVDAYGVSIDTDRDGVPDGIDQELTPYGCYVDSRGVALDGDRDGVPDGIDREPNTPPNTLVDAWGRSISEQGTSLAASAASGSERYLLDTGLIMVSNVHFGLGSAEITPDNYSTLTVLGTVLSRYPQLEVLVEGHADNIGSDEINQWLSFQRAQAVRNYLLENFSSIKPTGLTLAGQGENQPIADNRTNSGRIQNRRVAFKILNREVIKETTPKEEDITTRE